MTPPIKPSFALRALTNNADARFAGTVSSGDTTIALQTGHGAKLPQPRSGTATSTGNAQTLNDTGDLGVFAVGDFIENVTDGSIAIVLDVSGAPNSIKTTPLYGGSDNTWTSGDTWAKDRAILTFATLTDGVITTSERVKLTGRSTDSITVERGWDGDTPSGFSTGDYAYLLVEKSIMLEMQKAIKHMYMRIHESYLNTDRYAEASGTTGNAFSITLNPAITSLTDIIGMPINIKSDVTISGASTLSVNGLTAKNIKKNNGTTALGANNIESGQIFQVIYDGTNFQMQTFVPNTETLITIEDIAYYGDGSDGSPTWTSGASLDPDIVYNYTTATLPSGQTLTVSQNNKVLRARFTGDLTINGTINLSQKGASGGAGVGPGTNLTGNAGTSGASLDPDIVAGAGAGGLGASSGGGAGGGGGGSSALGNGSAGGSGFSAGGVGGTLSSGLALLASLLHGVMNGAGGGSAGVGTVSATSASGGKGGGAAVFFVAGDLTLGSSSSITADGENGGSGTGNNGASGSGGGGGGTVVFFVGGNIINNGVTLSAAKGSGGVHGGSNITGGDGKKGKIIIYSLLTGEIISSS